MFRLTIYRLTGFIVIAGLLCVPCRPQGCTFYHTFEDSGYAGGGPDGNTPISTSWLELVAQSQANDGGDGPYCSYTWYEHSPPNGYGNWYGDCYAVAWRCPNPPAAAPSAPSESCPTCNASNTLPTAANPINLATGNTYIRQTDVVVPGLGGGLNLTRTWNSMWPATQSAIRAGLFGNNWRSTYEERIFLGSDGTMKYSRADGSFWSFESYQTTTLPLGYYIVAPANAQATLTAQAGTTWTLTFPSGEQRIFDYTSGSLTSIVDRNGNTTELSYDALNRLVTVTDPGGQHLYFSYASGSSSLVTGVSSDFGVSLSYSYDSQGRLSQVTKPDLTFLTFAYDSNSMITSVTDSNGKLLESHTYDSSGRALTSSRANGVDSVAVSYGTN